MKANPQIFNIKENLPNVLLIGNGLLASLAEINGLAYGEWHKWIAKVSDEKHTQEKQINLEKAPYSIMATILTSNVDATRHNTYKDNFKTLEVTDNSLLKNLVDSGFDAILTTNYTYEIENCFHTNFSQLKDKSIHSTTIKRSSLNKKTDSRYLLHTFNQLKNSPPIWHIHGELRRKSSIVLTHDEYSKLIYNLVEVNRINKNKYVEFSESVCYKSWLDYFLMSNLYIVGFGMDFSEFDLWWILNRRMREKASIGEVVFYSPNNIETHKKSALEELKIKVRTFTEIPSNDYINLYKKATEEIKAKINK